MPGSVPELCRELGSPWSALRGRNGDREVDVQRELQPSAGTRRQGRPAWRGGGSECSAGRGAYAGCLSHMLEEPLGRDEEPEQAAEPVPLVACLQQPEHLAQHRGGRGFEGRVESLECALHRCVQ